MSVDITESGRYITKDDAIELIGEIVSTFMRFKFNGGVPDWVDGFLVRITEGIEAIIDEEMPTRLCDQCQYFHACAAYLTACTEWTNGAPNLARVCPNYLRR